LLSDAQWTEGRVHWRKNLPFYSTIYAGDGFFAGRRRGGGFYWIRSTARHGLDFVHVADDDGGIDPAQQRGEPLTERLARHNRDFTRSYERWFQAIYQDKYDYFDEFDLVKPWRFEWTSGFTPLASLQQPFQYAASWIDRAAVFHAAIGAFFYLMRAYNRGSRASRGRARPGIARPVNDNTAPDQGFHLFAQQRVSHREGTVNGRW